MSIAEIVRPVGVTVCAECGASIPRRSAFLSEGLAFCCVLHELEHLGASA